MAETRRNGDGVKALHRRLMEEAPEVVMVLDPDLVVRYASPATGRVLGLDPCGVAGNLTVIQGADHFFTGRLQQLEKAVLASI